MIFFDAKLINQNEIIFDILTNKPFNFFKLCRNLKIFPITLPQIFKRIESQNSQSSKTQISKENLRIDLKKKFSDKFEIFASIKLSKIFQKYF